MFGTIYTKNSIIPPGPGPEPTPETGFTLSNSEIAEVNGYYHEVTIDGINKSDFPNDDDYHSQYNNAIYNSLVAQNKIDGDIDFSAAPIYTNGNCYVNYGGMTTTIFPISGGDPVWYYKSVAGMVPISEMEEYGTDSWLWKNDPWHDESSDLWEDKNILHVESHDSKIY